MDNTTRTEPASAPAGDLLGIQTPEVLDRFAADYAHYIDPMTAPMARPALQMAPVDAQTTVLDVATGAGALALQAARQGARVLAVDLSRAFVRIVSERAYAEDLRNVTTEAMDGQDLAIGDAAFDRAYSMLGLMFFPDRARGFRELHRVLVPGGKAVVSSWPAPPENPFAILQESVAETLPELAAAAPPPPGMELADPRRLRSEMEEAGFTDVRVETVAHELHWTEPDHYWHAVTTANPIFGPVVARLEKKQVAALHDAVDRRLAALTDSDGEIHHPVAVHYGVGTKTQT